jgi:hypothetical protein
MDDGNVGGAVVWRIAEGEIGNWRVGWNWEGYHLGTGKEVFDAELYAILKTTRRIDISKGCNKIHDLFGISSSYIMLESILIRLACVRRKRIEFGVKDKDGETALGVVI